MAYKNNILIAQGGGPTNVINQSLAGIMINEKKNNSNLIGSIHGVNGIVNNKFKFLKVIKILNKYG